MKHLLKVKSKHNLEVYDSSSSVTIILMASQCSHHIKTCSDYLKEKKSREGLQLQVLFIIVDWMAADLESSVKGTGFKMFGEVQHVLSERIVSFQRNRFKNIYIFFLQKL